MRPPLPGADQIRLTPRSSRGQPPIAGRDGEGEGVVLEEDPQVEEIVARVAALDIGKAEVVCCVQVPQEGVVNLFGSSSCRITQGRGWGGSAGPWCCVSGGRG